MSTQDRVLSVRNLLCVVPHLNFPPSFVLQTNLDVTLIQCYLPPSFAELENQESRVSEIHSLVHRLPEKNRQMLQLLMNHLAK